MTAARLALVALVTAGLLYAMQHSQPSYADITGPFAVSGGPKEPLATRRFEVSVTGYKAARRLKTSASGGAGLLTTDGIWVLVAVKAKALNESLTLMSASWEGPNGAHYFVSGRMPPRLEMLAQQRLEPGLEKQAVLVFEVPESQLAGATLRIGQSPYTPLVGEAAIAMPAFDGDRVVDEIDLGL